MKQMRQLLGTCVLLATISSSRGLYRWKNDEVSAIRSNNPQVGHPLVLAASHRAEYTRTNCTLQSPSYESVKYMVVGDVVYDAVTGEVAEGVEAWNDGGQANVCGIKILSMDNVHDEGDELNSNAWTIKMRFAEGGIHGQPDLNYIEVGIHLKDDNFLKPELEDYLGHKPLHYDLSIIPDLLGPNQTISFRGTAKIELLVEDYPGFIIPVNMFAIDIRNLGGKVIRQSGEEEDLRIGGINYNLQEDIIIMFGLNSLMEPGDIVIPEIEYDANVNFNVMYGYGVWKQPCDGSQDPGAKHCWFTQFEAAGARQLFPCFDEPRAKATFDMRVARTDGWTTLFNTPVSYTEPVEGMDGWVWDVFQTTPVMSTYTMALAIQDFSSVPAANNMTVWAMTKHVEAGYADYAVEVGPQCVSAVESLYNVPYSLPKMDMVHVNNFGGAMENWGLILYEFDYLLYDDSYADPDDDRKYDVLETIAHELTHQWFGNLVTMAWWDQLWLNEGFATYVSIRVADMVDPAIKAWDRFVANQMFYVMKVDSRASAWALSDPVTSIDDIDRKFGLITYYKGGSVIRMMESFLGLSTFNKGLEMYLKDQSYATAEEEDLFIHLEAAGLEDGTWPQDGAEDLTEVMKTWTQQAGIPLINVTRVSDTELRLEQSWYQNHGLTTDQVWSVPVTMANLNSAVDNNWDDTTPDLWLNDVSVQFGVSSGFIPILNKKAVGYYRVTYSEDIWNEIADILRNDPKSIHPNNRAQLLCDVSHMSAHGYLNPGIANSILQYYDENEMDFVVNRAWDECFTGLEREKKFKRI